MPAGLLLVDKPAGITSHDVVARVRRAARTKRVGHAGTLDPFATGLLVVAIGSATRLLQFVQGEPKVYLADIAFGTETDTDDVTGKVVRSAPLPDVDAIPRAAAALTGAIEQLPPAFSAKHVDGKRAYDVARRGGTPALQPVHVTVHEWHFLESGAERAIVQISCSGGTYIRALARDLGRHCDSAAHCRALRRLASGPANVDDSTPLDVIAPGAIADGIVPLVNPLRLLGDIERVVLDRDGQRRLLQGRLLPAAPESLAARVVFLGDTDEVLGIGDRSADAAGATAWQPRVVLARDSEVAGS